MTAYAAPRLVVRPRGWWGMLMLVAAEATLFGCLVGTYFYLRFTTAPWPPAGIPEPDVGLQLGLAFLLAATSVPVLLAVCAARARRLAATRLLLGLALAVQAGYFAYSVHDFADRLNGFAPQSNAYGSIYFTLLGADHAHIAVGLLLEAWLLLKLARGLNAYRADAVWAVALYWHAVNVITLVVAGTLLSAAA